MSSGYSKNFFEEMLDIRFRLIYDEPMTNHKRYRIQLDCHADIDDLLRQVHDALNDDTDPDGVLEHVFVRLLDFEQTQRVELLGTQASLLAVVTEVWGGTAEENAGLILNHAEEVYI